MTKFWIITAVLAVFGIVVLVSTLHDTKVEQDTCEPFRLTAIQDVPVRCFEYFRKEFK